MQGDKRVAPRRRVRLRPVKLLTQGGRFLCDCAFVDRSPGGARVRAFQPPAGALPEDLMLFDEIETVKRRARIVWAAGAELGLAFASSPLAVGERERHRIAGRFYALDA